MKSDGILIHCNILHGRRLPGVINSHSTLLELAPDIFETVELKRADNGGEQLPWVIIGEGKPVAFTAARIIFLDCIGQATNGSHNGHAAIAHRYQLSQATWLKTRRHEEHIDARVDVLRNFSVEGEKNRYLLRVTNRKILKQLVIVLIANA